MKVKSRHRITNYLTALVSILFILSAGLNIYFLKKKATVTQISTQQESFIVTRVIDGDTFDLENGDRIRLANINAPEYPKDCMGIDSKARLEELILNKIVGIEKIGKDNFGRIIALTYLNKLSVNEILVEEGLAYFDAQGTLNKNSLEIERAQEKAKLTNRGVWSSLCHTQKEGCVIKGN
ncbi:hypothetical protein A3A46_04705 [Candidatus Roizmanbacteria bacterium RIFCSPLOWO2_01_FULL_37_13]|uniref:TNase-like domain-containing protein n=1 Tax=Candidatus Roizmanbacteria bacterium RIFCSPHIGHO2_02_FULL_38_11 TaxID=1802039 RepID=A0A1F7GYK3_9BACT|nr:MAG: hypothetical protein A3C25_04855 [Candidatus Roizmanbacteria bacterium RIFCSPHIGHO2_02_FULL_38_11]OGK34532.1 MAG: hypothetical protein A3F58_02195 [Candidatus Roizmanbacteria bacterium RIFCSPHIGHO2_12_FULL_37_9b]OGK41204.1 MAG: hypothetical protein A3A46_04705 [Candidatus Roizmanbacteria bacterium RIFCSPLOWO2_01_FULL_37_13]